MTNNLWINLPVKNLDHSIAFYEALGFERNLGPGNTDAASACFLVGKKKIVLMLVRDSVF